MKKFFTITLLIFTLVSCNSFRENNKSITVGSSIHRAKSLFKEFDYKSSLLQMETESEDADLSFWTFGDGYIIITYSKGNGRIISMSYNLSSGGPKALRKEYYFEITEIIPQSKTITIKSDNG